MNSTISVIIPVYNVTAYLSRCLDSVLSQSYPCFQAILVDDGSTDASGTICDDYAAKDSRFVVIHQKNGGLSAARNAGLDWVFANSDSHWIAFIDSDDWVHPQFLELMFRSATANKVTLACCEFVRVDSATPYAALDDIKVSIQHPRDIYIYPDGRGEGAFAWRYLYYRSNFEGVRYPEGKLWEDIATTPKAIFRTEQLAVVHAPLYFYFMNPEGISKREWTPHNLDCLEALEFNISFFSKKREERLYRQSVNSYLKNLAYQLDCVQRNSIKQPEKKRLNRSLHTKLRRAIWKYRKLHAISFATDGVIYASAWPGLTNCRWIIQSQVRKIKALINFNKHQCG